MPGKKDLRFKGGQAIERVQVGGDVALGVGDHRAALAEDQVAGEDRPIFRDEVAEVVGAVSGRVQGGEVKRAGADDLTVAQLRISLHGSVVGSGKSHGEGKVVRMPVCDEHHRDRLAREALVERIEMSIIVGAGVDHGDHRPGVHDPGVGPRPRVRTGVRSHDPAD